MNTRNRSWFGAGWKRWFARPRAWAILAAVLAVVGVALYALPRRVVNIVPAEGERGWRQDAAPNRWTVVWRPPSATPLRADVETPPAPDLQGVGDPGLSFLRPQLAEDGTALYFSLRDAAGQADVFRCERARGGWSEARPVRELNSDADDIGPAISADGQTLYLYSDRAGGEGGYDLYASRWVNGGWSAPRNLGPRINTPAHEYDPAISPDGLLLVFSSNRGPEAQRRASQAGLPGQPAGDAWRGTLRAETTLSHFDLYACARASADEAWPAAEPLRELNRDDANDGAPALAAGGRLLYFASDRPFRPGEKRNYDLYRARRENGVWRRVENLGAEVNTSANETEPTLADGGFGLYFSSDRESPPALADNPRYLVYGSRAVEVFAEPAWDTSHVPGLLRAGWWLLLAALLAGLLASLIYYLRQASLKRAPFPAFFLLALLFQTMAASGLFFVTLGGDLVEKIGQQLGEMAAYDYARDDAASGSAQPFEKVAEPPTDVAAEAIEAAHQAPRFEQAPLSPEMPLREVGSQVAASLPTELVVSRPAPTPVTQQSEPRLARSRPTAVQATPDETRVAPERLAEAKPAADARVERAALEAARSELARVEPAPTPVAAASNVSPAAAARQALETPAALAPNDAPRSEHSRPTPLARRQAPVDEPTERVAIEQPMAAPTKSGALAAAAPLEVAAARAENRLEATMPRVAAAPTATVAAAAEASTAPPPARLASEAPPVSANPLVNPLQRVTPNAPLEFEPAPVEAAATSAPRASSNETPVPTQVAQERAAAEAPAPASDATRVALASLTAQPRATPTEALARRVDFSVVEPSPAAALETPRALRRAAAQVDVEAVEAAVAAVNATAEARASSVLTTTAESLEAARMSPVAPPVENVAGAPPPTTLPRALARGGAADLPREIVPEAEPVSNAGEARSPLARPRAAAAFEGETAPVETVAAVSTNKSSGETPAVAGLALEAVRASAASLEPAPSFPGAVETSARVARSTAQASRLAREGQTAGPPTRDLLASTLPGRPRRLTELLYAEGEIGLQAMFRLRQGDDKRDFVEAFGGTDETMNAVKRGLLWLGKRQAPDGHWSLHEFDKHVAPAERTGGHGSQKADHGGTGLALMAFLGDGQTHQRGEYQAQVKKGLDWLRQNQKKSGELARGDEGHGRMYSHAIATIALCEAHGMTQDPELREPAQRAINFLLETQHRATGGWRYQPNEYPDTSVVGWALMALKSAQMAGLEVPEANVKAVAKWLDIAEGRGAKRGLYGYQGPQETPAMTAEALLCRLYLGAGRHDPSMAASVGYLLKNLPSKKQENSYYWYYATQSLYHLQGENWKTWNASLRDLLVETQKKSGPAAGSWDPAGGDRYEQVGGRVYATSLRLLMLEVYYRHLPLTQIAPNQ